MWTVAELRFPLVIKITVGATTLQAWEGRKIRCLMGKCAISKKPQQLAFDSKILQVGQ